MQQISVFTTNPEHFAKALEGKWERSDKDKSKWVILGKIAFCEDSWSKDNFPYDVLSWHHSDGGYWGILK